MAISVTSDLSTISIADATSSSGTFYRLGGATSSNPAADADAYVEGAGCIAWKCSGTTGTTDTGGHFNSTAAFDITNKHLFIWRLIVTAGNMLTKANQGVVVGLTNTSTTSTSAWSTTNMKKWFVDGSDTMPISAGWKCYVIDPSSAGNETAGTLTLSTVKNVGIMCRQTSGVTSTLNNVFCDAIKMGTGLTATASAGGDVITFTSLYNTDKTTANAWGIITQTAGIWYGSAKISIGSTGQTNVCNFTDSSQVLVWRDYPVANTLYEFLLKGASGFKTTMTLTACVIRGQASTAVWAITCNDAFSDFKAYNCAFANISAATLSSASVLSGCTLAQSGLITTNGASVTGCTFTPATGINQITASAGANAAAIQNSTFTSGGTGHGLVITGTATATTLTNLTWSGYAAGDGSTGNEAVYVNIATGSMNLTISGGTTPSVRTAGCNVTVVTAARTIKVVTMTPAGATIASATVHLHAIAGGPFPYDATVTITRSGTTATVSHTSHGMATNDQVEITGITDKTEDNGLHTITWVSANSYSYTTTNSGSTSYTGTIKSGFVFFHGTTNGSGEISLSRSIPSNQPVTGWGRKASASPYYKEGSISGTVLSASDTTFNAVMALDE